MKKETTFCDKCKAEIESNHPWVMVLTHPGNNPGSGPKYDLCKDCVDWLLNAIRFNHETGA